MNDPDVRHLCLQSMLNRLVKGDIDDITRQWFAVRSDRHPEAAEQTE